MHLCGCHQLKLQARSYNRVPFSTFLGVQPETALLKWCLFGPGWLHSIFHYSQTVISVKKKKGGGGGGGLFQCFWVDIISWPLWQQSKRAAQHLKNISQDPAQLAHFFKYRPDTLALLPGQTYMFQHMHTHASARFVCGNRVHFFSITVERIINDIRRGSFYLLTFTLQIC